MKAGIVFSLLALTGASVAVEFEDPVMLKADNGPIRVESPGYASPSFADINGDGKKELLVGQFSQGNIWVYPQEPDGSYVSSSKLMVNGSAAIVPGVW